MTSKAPGGPTGRAAPQAAPHPGRLVVVGTPIGNLGDMSPRAVSALASVDVVMCEDTRRARKLLSALGIPAPRLVRLDQHNEAAAARYVEELVRGGAAVAMVSDAGMPVISDPGQPVVALLAAAGLTIDVVPGPTAVSAALALSGLPASRYHFEGFLARKGRERAGQLDSIARSGVTTVVYESPRRVVRTVSDLAAVCGPDRPFAAARELTKLHQQTWRGTLGAAVVWLESPASAESLRGEWVLVVGAAAGLPEQAAGGAEITAALRSRLAAGGDRRRAVAEVATALGVPKRDVYNAAVALREPPKPITP